MDLILFDPNNKFVREAGLESFILFTDLLES